jgi:hypothetical protein
VELLNAARYLLGVFGALIAIIALLTLIFGWKIFRRRGWARWLQIIFFTGFLIATLLLLFAGASVDPEFQDIGGTLFLGAYAGALGLILLLLILPPTSRDFRRVREWEAPAPQMQVQPVTPPPPPPPPPSATTP